MCFHPKKDKKEKGVFTPQKKFQNVFFTQKKAKKSKKEKKVFVHPKKNPVVYVLFIMCCEMLHDFVS